MRRVDVGGVAVGALSAGEWVEHLSGCVATGGLHHHVSMNAAKWVALRSDPELRRVVREATSVAADGVGIVWAARLAGTPLPQRVPGADLAQALIDRAIERGWRVGLLGARAEVLRRVVDQLDERGAHVAFAHHGYFTDEAAIAASVQAAAPDLLLVALGSPRAEHFIGRRAAQMRVPLVLGVGGTFDVWAGVARRAPRLAQRAGLEWAWRLALSPRARFERALLDTVRFAVAVARGERVDQAPP